MPRAPRKKEEVEKVRDEILDHALDIICSEGYDNLSMRKLGDRLGCAAKTIYNYYSSKEEIYLLVLTRGFEELDCKASKAIKGIFDPVDRLRRLGNVYVDFGMENSNYYNIMFNWDVPKHADYVGTVLEPIARKEKETAFLFAQKAENAVSEMFMENKAPREEVTYQIIKLWSGLHGIVSLCNSHGIDEYVDDSAHFLRRLVEDLLMEIVRSSQKE